MTASRTAGHRLARVHHLGVRAAGDALGDAGDAQVVAHPTFPRRTS
ncbi:hypothetical protein [Actinophytocola sp.]|nr:hypothetical protein [Actinophytocola sp.]HYQ69227.1 hypothetical protein [Actinophytocola sp.]